MASKKALRTPGHEPFKQGRPDPIPPVTNPRMTHAPAGRGIGALCPVQPIPTHASEYDANSPTCPWCKNYVDKTRAHTAARSVPGAGRLPSLP
jgi:hypothetical protein